MKILIVDDDYTSSYLIAKFCNDLCTEAHLTILSDSITAAALISTKIDFDIMFFDYQMPKMNGIELAEFARFKGYKDKIYLVTCQPSGLDSMAVDAILLKPIMKHDFKQLFNV
jgi:CheY-like chemotaxis protein